MAVAYAFSAPKSLHYFHFEVKKTTIHQKKNVVKKKWNENIEHEQVLHTRQYVSSCKWSSDQLETTPVDVPLFKDKKDVHWSHFCDLVILSEQPQNLK